MARTIGKDSVFMKKILACSLCLMLVGCGSGNSQEAGNPAKDEIAIPKFEEFAEDYAAAKMENTSLLCNAGSKGCEASEVYVKYDGENDFSSQFEESKALIASLAVEETEKPQPLGNVRYRLSVSSGEDEVLYLNVSDGNICAINNGKGNKYTTWYQMSDDNMSSLISLVESYSISK